MIHEYYFEFVKYFSKLFDIEHLHNLDGLDVKVLVIETFFTTSGRFTSIITQHLKLLDLTVSPSPLFTNAFDTRSVLLKYTNVVYEQMKKYPVNVMNTWIKQERTGKDMFKFAPWVPIKLQNGKYFRSNIPEELHGVLSECLGYASVTLLDESHREELTELNSRIRIGSLKCFLRLASLYRATIKTWEQAQVQVSEQHADEAYEEYIMWVCSIANDAFRVLKLGIFALPMTGETSKLPPDSAIAVELTTSYTDLERDALDAISRNLMDLLFDDKLKLVPINAALHTFQAEYAFYEDCLADQSMIDMFAAICADKAVLLYLNWIEESMRNEPGKGNCTLVCTVCMY
jgi:hypothetical protein